MSTLIPANLETVVPSEADALLARESSRRLAAHTLGKRSSIRIQLLDDDEARARVLDQLTAEAQELGMGY